MTKLLEIKILLAILAAILIISAAVSAEKKESAGFNQRVKDKLKTDNTGFGKMSDAFKRRLP